MCNIKERFFVEFIVTKSSTFLSLYTIQNFEV